MLLFWKAEAFAPSEQALVHVMKPVVQVTIMMHNGQNKMQVVLRSWKRLSQGCLALLLLVLQGLSIRHA